MVSLPPADECNVQYILLAHARPELQTIVWVSVHGMHELLIWWGNVGRWEVSMYDVSALGHSKKSDCIVIEYSNK